MISAPVASFEPVPRWEYLDRLAVAPPTPAATPELWTEVNDVIQIQLGLVETEVRQQTAGIQVDAGRF